MTLSARPDRQSLFAGVHFSARMSVLSRPARCRGGSRWPAGRLTSAAAAASPTDQRCSRRQSDWRVLAIDHVSAAGRRPAGRHRCACSVPRPPASGRRRLAARPLIPEPCRGRTRNNGRRDGSHRAPLCTAELAAVPCPETGLSTRWSLLCGTRGVGASRCSEDGILSGYPFRIFDLPGVNLSC